MSLSEERIRVRTAFLAPPFPFLYKREDLPFPPPFLPPIKGEGVFVIFFQGNGRTSLNEARIFLFLCPVRDGFFFFFRRVKSPLVMRIAGDGVFPFRGLLRSPGFFFLLRRPDFSFQLEAAVSFLLRSFDQSTCIPPEPVTSRRPLSPFCIPSGGTRPPFPPLFPLCRDGFSDHYTPRRRPLRTRPPRPLSCSSVR